MKTEYSINNQTENFTVYSVQYIDIYAEAVLQITLRGELKKNLHAS